MTSLRSLLGLAPLALALVTGCPGSHEAPADGGSDARAPVDAPSPIDVPTPIDAPPGACRLEDPAEPPPAVGEGCFCNGPFAVRGSFAYRLAFMLEAIDLSDPDAPVVVTSVANEARYSTAVAIVDDVLFAAGGALEAFDLSDPRAPTSLGAIALDGEAVAMAVDGERLVVAIRRPDESHAILGIDASDPRDVTLGPLVEIGTSAPNALAVGGTVAYAVLMAIPSGAPSLVSVDLVEGVVLDELDRPMGAASLPAMALLPGTLFVSAIGHGVDRIDVTDPSSLVALGPVSEATMSVFSLGLTGDRLMVMGDGVALFDASDPRALVPLGRATSASDLGHAEIVGTHLVVSGGNSLSALPLTCD